MLPVCSTTISCSCHLQVPFHGRLKPISPFMKTFDVNCNNVDKRRHVSCLYSNYSGNSGQYASSMINSLHKSQFEYVSKLTKSVYQVGVIDNSQSLALNSSSGSNVEDQLIDLLTKTLGNSDVLQIEPPPLSQSLDIDISVLSDQEENVINGIMESATDAIYGAENVLSQSLDKITSILTSGINEANEAVDNVRNDILTFLDKSGESASSKLSGFSGQLKEASGKTGIIALDVLRRTIVVIEDSLTKGASTAGYAYGSAKQYLPPEFQDTLSSSEESVIKVLRPIGNAFQQVYTGIEGLEKLFGLYPNDPLIPFVLFLGLSATLWGSYRVLKYSGYAGDLSPQSAMELLQGNENAVLIDIRPEDVRERDGIPDLRRKTRNRYASVTVPEVDGSVKKLLKGGRDIEDSLLAAVIRNLKIVEDIRHGFKTILALQDLTAEENLNHMLPTEKLLKVVFEEDRSKVLVMDADGTRSKAVARSLRKLGTKRPYLVQGGFQSWVKEELRIKELKPETALTILNEDAEAILEEFNPTPLKVIGYGVGVIAAAYSFIEMENTLQFIGVIGLSLTIYRRLASYQGAEDFKQDVSLLLSPVRYGGQAISWAAGKIEPGLNGLPTSPSSSDIQSRVLQAAAKHESKPSDLEQESQDSSQIKENVNISEA